MRRIIFITLFLLLIDYAFGQKPFCFNEIQLCPDENYNSERQIRMKLAKDKTPDFFRLQASLAETRKNKSSAICSIDEILLQLENIKKKCHKFYNLKTMVPFVEMYKGKEVWLIGDILNEGNSKLDKIWKRSSGNKSLSGYRWLYNIMGSAKKSFQSDWIGSFNDIEGVNCIFHDFIFAPSRRAKPYLNVAKDRYYGRELMSLNEENMLYESEYGSFYFTIDEENYIHKKYNELAYEYYAVFTINPDKTYITRTDTITPEIADTLYIPYSESLKKFVTDNDKFMEMYNACLNWEENEWKEYNEREKMRYEINRQEWGEKTASRLRRGLVEYGQTIEMCLYAFRDQEYYIFRKETPFGIAKCYKFKEQNITLIFIDNHLIGIQGGKRKPLYFWPKNH